MTATPVVHVTNRVTPPGSECNNPRRAYSRQNTVQLMTPGSMVHVTNLTPPGSGVPTLVTAQIIPGAVGPRRRRRQLATREGTRGLRRRSPGEGAVYGLHPVDP